MSILNPRMHSGRKGAALAIRVVPRARKNEIVKILEDGSIKIRLNAPPVDGQANAALIEFLGQILAIPVDKLEIVAGKTGRLKIVTILDMDTQVVQQKLLEEIS